MINLIQDDDIEFNLGNENVIDESDEEEGNISNVTSSIDNEQGVSY